MKNYLIFSFLLTLTLLILNTNSLAQRDSVSGKEVTGTFRLAFTGKYKGSSSDILIQALGGGKIKIGFDLIYPYTMSNGDLMANVGQLVVEAKIRGDKAVYSTNETDGKCEITVHFVKPGVIEVTQEQEGAACGFGMNVTAKGTYKKVSSAKPNFSKIIQ
ncbi:MAG TPA: hypothetical protein PKY82_26710 [Pyrinomonadaceae bacterium]|nr:hypothetical protein [Pyrinomonadaceae bacterium]